MELNATTEPQELHSPGYNHLGYPLSVECDWVISQPDGLDIQIDIVDLKMEEDAECLFDGLIILDGENCELCVLFYSLSLYICVCVYRVNTLQIFMENIIIQ